MRIKVLLLLVGFIIILSSFQDQSPTVNSKLIKTESQNVTVDVNRVIDGDTIEVSLDGKKDTVRLIGIDAPEIDDRRQDVKCLGLKASNFARTKLSNQTVRLESDSTQGNRDKYGRLLRYVFVNDLNFNEYMIGEGFAHEYTYNFPYQYQSEFKIAEKDARANQKGLWDKNNQCYN